MESLWCLCDHETDTESISHDNVLFYINYLHKFQTLYTSSQHAVSVEAEKLSMAETIFSFYSSW